MSVNKVILIGRLGKDPESRYTDSGQSRCNFSIATDEKFKGKDGQKHERTEWHRIVVWGKQAEIAQQHLKKGSLLYLEGRIQSREWEKDGQKRTATEIVASNFRMLGGGKRDEQDQRTPEETTEAQHVPDDSDIPF